MTIYLNFYKITTAQATAKQAKYPNANPVIIKAPPINLYFIVLTNFKILYMEDQNGNWNHFE